MSEQVKPMTKEDKTMLAIIIFYILMGLATNSYVRNYRYDEWKESAISTNTNKNEATFLVVMCIGAATIGWPVYVVGKAFDKMWDTIFSIKIDVEKPEVLK